MIRTKTSHTDYLIDQDEIKFVKTLCESKHVRVYTAYWRHQLICVKQLLGDRQRHIRVELIILSKCIHPRIVQFLGYFGKDSIAFEYMDRGNLYDYVRATVLSQTDRVAIMKDIAIGLHYLHNRKPSGVLHRDLKPQNILVNGHGEAKIADFDVSKLIPWEQTKTYMGHTGETGSYAWTSPEVLKHEPYNYTADIYSLGLVFYFVWTSRVPFDATMSTVQLAFRKVNNTIQVERVGDNMFIDNLIQTCSSHDKHLRPSTENIIQQLLEHRHAM